MIAALAYAPSIELKIEMGELANARIAAPLRSPALRAQPIAANIAVGDLAVLRL